MTDNFIKEPSSSLNVNGVELINQLPYAITVHDNHDKIIYENNKAIEIFGIRPDNDCTSRWCHHSDYAENACPMCPGKFTKFDKKEHKVFRKLIDPTLNIRYLEFETIPVLNSLSETDGYIEIVRDVTEGETIKIQNIQQNVSKVEPRIFSMVKYGKTGSEILLSDNLPFREDSSSFIMKLASFAFIGVLQNNTDRTGLYGPLPVLDEKNYEMFTFAFSVSDKTISDPRKNQQELILLLLIFERNDIILNINRKLINDLLTSYVFNLKSINDLTQDWFNLIKMEISKLTYD